MATLTAPHMGRKLLVRLAQLNMSQVDLAAKIGMTRQGVSALAKSSSWHSKTLHKVAHAVQMPVTYFFE